MIKFYQLTLILVFLFFSLFTQAQTYYSGFDTDPESHMNVTVPDGGLCYAPDVKNKENIATTELDDFAIIPSLLMEPLECTSNEYSFSAGLNFLGETDSLPAGSQAGFRIRFSNYIDDATLNDNIKLITYLKGKKQETTAKGSILGLDLLYSTSSVEIYFNTIKAFDSVQLVLNEELLPVGSALETDVYYAFGRKQSILPVKLSNLNAVVDHHNVNLSWNAYNESYIDGYYVQRSIDGRNFSTVGFVKAINSGIGTRAYNFTDKVPMAGNYYYRLQIKTADAATGYSNQALAIILNSSNLLVYPTLLQPGEQIKIKTSDTGPIAVLVYNMQGKLMLKQQTNTSGLITINSNSFIRGVYIMKIISSSGISQAKFIVN